MIEPPWIIGILKEGENITVLEGNHRICACKLLINPDLSPNDKLKKKFHKLAREWKDPRSSVECCIFDTRKEARIWLDRLHNGLQDGRGRNKWTSLQKQKWDNKPENRKAALTLKYAVQQGWISEDNAALTTITRFLSNEKLRDAIGIYFDEDGLSRIKKYTYLNIFWKVLFLDLINKTINSRFNKDRIEAYANKLISDNRNIFENDQDIDTLNEPVLVLSYSEENLENDNKQESTQGDSQPNTDKK